MPPEGWGSHLGSWYDYSLHSLTAKDDAIDAGRRLQQEQELQRLGGASRRYNALARRWEKKNPAGRWIADPDQSGTPP